MLDRELQASCSAVFVDAQAIDGAESLRQVLGVAEVDGVNGCAGVLQHQAQVFVCNDALLAHGEFSIEKRLRKALAPHFFLQQHGGF